MHFDDRLATVLRHRAAGERAARTQFRQLLDLLGNRRHGRDESLLAAAWLRLAALGETLPAAERAAMIREPGLRFRNPELALHLAADEPEVAAAALAVSRLEPDEWEALIPRLPVRARGFLRLRRDLSRSAIALLERLGVRDRALPMPESAMPREEPAEESPPTPASPPARPRAANDAADDEEPREDSEIGALVRRIEAFRRTRGEPREEAPQLPLGEHERERAPLAGFAFTTDAEGRIDWAEPAVAPMVVGAVLEPARKSAARHRQPLRRAKTNLEGAPAIAGAWIVDAAPRFTEPSGHFYGYAGKFRRPPPSAEPASAHDREADHIRQLLHELRTPVNAIQGFAEVIQQQLFGPTPHEYRALAAGIAGDAARMLAGFDELDRLTRLEAGSLELESGSCDFAAIAARLAAQLQEALGPRGAGFEPNIAEEAIDVPLAQGDAEALAWRLLATVAGAAGAGENLALELASDGDGLTLSCELPATLAARSDLFAPGARSTGALSAGMFGAGTALRLARAEARAAGGDLAREGDRIVLSLPLLTARQAGRSQALQSGA